MFTNKHKYIFLFFFLILLTNSVQIWSQTISIETDYFVQGNQNRTAAEWEPALGTMIVWPLSIPYKLARELAKDSHLFTLVENEDSKNEASKWYLEWGIDTSKFTFIFAPQGIDAWWVRDWGPSAVFSPDNTMSLGDGKYIFATPLSEILCSDSLVFIYKTADNQAVKTEVDDNATIPLGQQLNISVLDLPYVTTGGNVLTDGMGTAFSSCILLNENKYFGVDKEKFFKLNKELSGFNQYHILSNFEKLGIQHVDCLMKVLDEERLLVIEPPKDHELYDIYENIVQNELSILNTPYGRPYEIVRLKTGRYKDGSKRNQSLAAYSNSIIVNKTIYVPLFQIPEDKEALKRWEELMPGYTVKGFEFELANEPIVSAEMKKHYNEYGWNYGDALHCRTRAIWDPEMLYISVKKLPNNSITTANNRLFTSIIDYSGKGIVDKKVQLVWREKNSSLWNHITMEKSEIMGGYFVDLPLGVSKSVVEYFVTATSFSGKVENRPRTAPLGFYTTNFE
ncbi:MAG: agmatine deiminase family protein [Saprospiraceae bacterium]